VVAADDADALAKALLTVIRQPELASRLGAGGRHKASHFTLERLALQWDALVKAPG